MLSGGIRADWNSKLMGTRNFGEKAAYCRRVSSEKFKIDWRVFYWNPRSLWKRFSLLILTFASPLPLVLSLKALWTLPSSNFRPKQRQEIPFCIFCPSSEFISSQLEKILSSHPQIANLICSNSQSVVITTFNRYLSIIPTQNRRESEKIPDSIRLLVYWKLPNNQKTIKTVNFSLL